MPPLLKRTTKYKKPCKTCGKKTITILKRISKTNNSTIINSKVRTRK